MDATTTTAMSAPVLIRVLLALDDEQLRRRLRGILNPAHVFVTAASSGEDGWRRFPAESHDLLITDALPTGGESMATRLTRLRGLPERPDVVVFRAAVSAERQAELIGAGCLAVLEPGISDDTLQSTLGTFINRRRDKRLDDLAAVTPERTSEDVEIVAVSEGMRHVLATARRLASSASSVLILGETGVGKGRIANLIHEQGPWSRGPFVELNCAAIPSELFESELFGHERGAFTGATRARRGRFELADQGTLFLDEVGEVPMYLQAKLLRVLQTRRVEPIGSERSVSVKVRIIAATNRDLMAEVEAGRFRRDLYYRLGVVELEIPPLRTRPEDIPELARTYLAMLSTYAATEVKGIEARAMEALCRYAWPGNVRELVNVIERATLLCSGPQITVADLPDSIVATLHPAPEDSYIGAPAAIEGDEDEPLSPSDIPASWLDRPWKQVRGMIVNAGERAYLEALLRRHGGKIGVTAAHAGLSPRALFEKMRRHGLRKEDFRHSE